MAFPKPTKLPEWASGGTADVVEPTAGEKSLGWVAGQTPPAPYMNWLMGADFGYFPWLQYVSTFEQQALTWPLLQTFDGGFTANGPVDFEDVVEMNAGASIGGGLDVTGGLNGDAVTSETSVSAQTGNFTGQVSAGSFAELELTTPYSAIEVATAVGGLYVSGNGMVDPASISSSNSGSAFAIIKAAVGNSNPMQVAASFDIPTGASIAGISAVTTNGASSAVTLTCAAYVRFSNGTRQNIVTQGATTSVPANVSNYSSTFNASSTPSVWTARSIPSTKATRVEVVFDTGLLPSGFSFNFLAITVTYSQAKPRP